MTRGLAIIRNERVRFALGKQVSMCYVIVTWCLNNKTLLLCVPIRRHIEMIPILDGKLCYEALDNMEEALLIIPTWNRRSHDDS